MFDLQTDDFRFRGPMGAADDPAAFVEQIRRNAPMFGDVHFSDVRRVDDGNRANSAIAAYATRICSSRRRPRWRCCSAGL